MLVTMIVEDNIPFREMFKSGLLSELPSMHVIEAGNGEEAFQKLASYPTDLIFMDIGLPGQNGLEITRKIKTERQDLPIVMVTNYDLPEYQNAAAGCGANGFITKGTSKWEDISTLVRCHHEARAKGGKPVCMSFASSEVGV